MIRWITNFRKKKNKSWWLNFKKREASFPMSMESYKRIFYLKTKNNSNYTQKIKYRLILLEYHVDVLIYNTIVLKPQVPWLWLPLLKFRLLLGTTRIFHQIPNNVPNKTSKLTHPVWKLPPFCYKCTTGGVWFWNSEAHPGQILPQI